jgi:hypothetical protein
MRVDLDAGSSSDAPDDAADAVTFEGSAFVRDEAAVSADVIAVGCGPVGEHLDTAGGGEERSGR